jgi:hypothetical protein
MQTQHEIEISERRLAERATLRPKCLGVCREAANFAIRSCPEAKRFYEPKSRFCRWSPSRAYPRPLANVNEP